jgi:hypothetical protein
MRRQAWMVWILLLTMAGGGAQAAWPGQFADVDTWPEWAIKGKRIDKYSFQAWGGDLTEAIWWELMIGDPPPNGNPLQLRTFRPQETITRAEYATILARALGVETAPQPGADWYRPTVATLKRSGIIKEEGDFTLPITRREMGSWVGHAIAWYGVDVGGRPDVTFSDIAALPEAPLISLAAKAGVIKGYPDGTFGPERTATRAEAAAMTMRVAKQLQKHLPDIGLFKEQGRAAWAAITAGEKRVAQGEEYHFSHLLEPYLTPMLLYGPDGYDATAQAYFKFRRDDSYRELVTTQVAAIYLRDTVALLRVTDTVKRTKLDGTVITLDDTIYYAYYAKRGERWVRAHTMRPSEYPEGWLPKPESDGL